MPTYDGFRLIENRNARAAHPPEFWPRLKPKRPSRKTAGLTPEEIIEDTCAEYHVTVEDVKGRSHSRTVAAARCVAMKRLYSIPWLTLGMIGEMFGRDHTTVCNAQNRKTRRPPSRSREEVVRAGCLRYGVRMLALFSSTRSEALCDARRFIAVELRRAGWSYPEIAHAMGREFHSSAHHLVNGRTRA